jgi:2-polyprenyl-3-methyl-5-hydroxy-6-metoxy-1,4-benzoquinol methylase
MKMTGLASGWLLIAWKGLSDPIAAEKVSMISQRFESDGRAVRNLNELQVIMRDQVERKVQQGDYSLESPPCPICASNDLKPIAGKDRYGLTLHVAICEQCGLIQTNPRMNAAAYHQFYNIEYRKLYGAVNQPTQTFFDEECWKGRQILKFLKRHKLFTPNTDQLVLEVGCGAGGILKVFQDDGCQVIGIDIGAEYVQYGRTFHGLNLLIGTLESIELPRAPDLVIYEDVLEHVLDPITELENLLLCIHPETLIYIGMPGVKSLPYNLNYQMNFLQYLQNAHVWHFTLTSLRNLLARAGYEDVTGNENIQTVFRKSATARHRHWENDYDSVMMILQRLEQYRILYASIYYIRWIIREITRTPKRIAKLFLSLR